LVVNASFSITERDASVALPSPIRISALNDAARKTLRGRHHAPLAWRRALLCIAAGAALSLSVVERSFAENPWARSRNAWGSSPNAWGNSKTPWANSQDSWSRSPSPKPKNRVPSNYGGYVAVPPEGIVALPSMEPRDGKYIDRGAIPDGLEILRRPPKRPARHLRSNAPAGTGRPQLAPRHSRKPQTLKEP
jgi:hypothetical protein